MRCYRPHLSLVKLIKAGAILLPPFFGPNMKKVLDLFETNLFWPDYEESSRSVRDKSFPIKNIPGLKTRNNKAATKQKGQIGEIYFLTAFLFWVKTNSSEFIFLKFNQVWLISWFLWLVVQAWAGWWIFEYSNFWNLMKVQIFICFILVSFLSFYTNIFGSSFIL